MSAALGYDAVELVQIGVEVKHVDGDPFHDIDVLGKDDDCLEVTLDEGGLDEWTAEIERLGSGWADR